MVSRHGWGLRLPAAALLASLLAACTLPGPPTRSNYPPAVQSTAPSPSGPTVTVVAGDTLYGIAKKTGVPLRALIEANNLSAPYTIYRGQKLALPGAAREHVVKRGETLYSISRDYGVDSTTLARTNKLPPPYGVTPGTRLVLADARPSQAAVAPPSQPSQAPAQPQIIGSISAPPGSSGPPALRPPVERVTATPPPETPAAESAPAAALSPESQIAPPAQLAPLAAIPPRSGRTFEWPVRGKLLARYGTQGKGLHNDGINIAARSGTRVRAAESGVVAYAGNELRGFGNLLLIKHADGWVTAYAHNEKLLVGRGDQIARGQGIAIVGATGNVSEPQLHFEVRRGQRALDPLKYLGPVTAQNFDVAPAKVGASPASFPAAPRDPG
ncbi:MAG TPA: LysM peptidoglycan-binding domain-containing M23 family metallopeptidase [Alphaproteobacteria bacterium]